MVVRIFVIKTFTNSTLIHRVIKTWSDIKGKNSPQQQMFSFGQEGHLLEFFGTFSPNVFTVYFFTNTNVLNCELLFRLKIYISRPTFPTNYSLAKIDARFLQSFLRDLLREASKSQEVTEDKLIEYTDTMVSSDLHLLELAWI